MVTSKLLTSKSTLLAWKLIVCYLYGSSYQDTVHVHAVLKGWRSVTVNTADGRGKIQLRSSFFCLVTQSIVAIHYRRFTKTYRSHIQGSSSWFSWPLKTGPIGFHETSVRNYHYNLRKTPEKSRFHPIRGRSLKSRNFDWFHRTEFLISPCS